MAKKAEKAAKKRAQQQATTERPPPPAEEAIEQAKDPFEWVKARRRPLTVAAVVLAVVAGGIWLTMVTAERKEQAAQAALEQARNAFDSQNLPAAASEFQRVSQTYSGTRAATEALLALNQVRMINGQNELAIVSLRELLDQGPDPRFGVPAHGLLGAALENVNRPGEAAQAFVDGSQLADVDYLKAEYLLEAGRAYLAAGEPEQAKEVYERIVTDYSETPSYTEAQVRLGEVLRGDFSDAPTKLRGGQ
jgi:tetratricopeptide (TPR) repeat protein